MIKYKDYYNYLNESIVKQMDIENLLPDKDNMEVAVESFRKGMRSPSNSPIEDIRAKTNILLLMVITDYYRQSSTVNHL